MIASSRATSMLSFKKKFLTVPTLNMARATLSSLKTTPSTPCSASGKVVIGKIATRKLEKREKYGNNPFRENFKIRYDLDYDVVLESRSQHM